MYVLLLIRIVLFFISNIGYYLYLEDKTDIHVSFLPMVTIGIQVTVLTLAGILNILKEAAFLLFLTGILLTIVFVYKNKFSTFRKFKNISCIYLCVCFAVLILCLRGSRFTHYDNFSHWALAVKYMLRDNRFPNFQSSLIQFQAYPLGSATYIYYFCRIIGISESFQMLAQGFMMISALMPLFRYSKAHSISTLIYVLLFTNFIFVYLIQITELLVDTLLPLFGMGTIFFVYSECLHNQKNNESDQKLLIEIAIPLLITTGLIKNSGILFVAIADVIILTVAIQNKKLRVPGILAVLAPAGTLFLWNKHCVYAYGSAQFSKHAMTISNYREGFSAKTREDIVIIVKSVLSYMVKNKTLCYVFIIMGILLILTFLLKRDQMKKITAYTVSLICLYIIYTLGMCAMYIFSMPLGEALTISGIDRYTGTIFVAEFYAISVIFIELEAQLDTRNKFLEVFCIMILCVLVMWKELGGFHVVSGNAGAQPRTWISQQLKEYSVPEGSSCYIFTDNSGYLWYMGRYLLWSSDIEVGGSIDEETISQLKQSEFIIIEKQNDPDMNDWILKNYPDQSGRAVICTKK